MLPYITHALNFKDAYLDKVDCLSSGLDTYPLAHSLGGTPSEKKKKKNEGDN